MLIIPTFLQILGELKNMATPFIAEIVMFGGNFAPRSWAFCQGQILSIAQNTALFSLLGTTYGGNGQTTFALPDLRGRVPIQPGQGPGLTPRVLGEQGGQENVTLLTTQIPAHTHSLGATTAAAGDTIPTGNILSEGSFYHAPPANTTLSPTAIGPTGGSQPHNNMQPFLAINFIIATQGIFPSRN